MLDTERQRRLDEIGFEWGLANVSWDATYALLQQFKKREGHCKVPQSHTEDGANLGRWVKTQRHLTRKEKLAPERQKRLEEIGFEWGLTSATWDETYAILQQFKKREGHCKVPISHAEDGANLGEWASTQRKLKKKETLDPERQNRLEEIGFGWVLTTAKWDKTYALLQQFKKREGHCKVPKAHTEDGSNLGTWATTQRQFKKKETLSSERQKRLEEIGFEWGRIQEPSHPLA
jgi:predicted transglutaminase-like cysteine proteinase